VEFVPTSASPAIAVDAIGGLRPTRNEVIRTYNAQPAELVPQMECPKAAYLDKLAALTQYRFPTLELTKMGNLALH
jgi:hypothetical protein